MIRCSVDTHVHIYPDRFATDWATSAHANLSRHLTSDRAEADWYRAIFLYGIAAQPDIDSIWRRSLHASWRAEEIDGGYRLESGERVLYLLIGRQWKTYNNLELLTPLNVDIRDGLSLEEMAQSISAGEYGVVPWGAGKWLGARGREVSAVRDKFPDRIHLADNGGRMRLWHVALLNAAAKEREPVLLGSDPLPTESDHQRLGNAGMLLKFDLPDSKRFCRTLRRALVSPKNEIGRFGAGISCAQFIKNQIEYRL